MDWLFENLGKLAPLALFLFYLLSALKGKSEEEPSEDPEAAERARKIQEEIRRKIFERQQQGRGQSVAPAPAERERVSREEEEEMPEWYQPDVREAQYEPDFEPEEAAAAAGAFPTAAYEDAFEAQKREIMEREGEVKALLESANITPTEVRLEQPVSANQRASSAAMRSRVRRGLAGPTSLKTSFVLKEILDTPVGMR